MRNIPIIVLNASISERSFKWYMRFRKGFASLFHPLHVFARDAFQARRFQALGVPRARILVGGNLKRLPDKTQQRLPPPAALVEWMARRPTLVAASTHAPEESVLLRACSNLRKRGVDLNLLIAPRHIRRPDLCRGMLGTLCRRSRMGEERVASTLRVVLLDSHGELAALLHHAWCVFAGGTLAHVGGHNILEALRAGKILLCGPERASIEDDLALLKGLEAVETIENTSALESVLERLAKTPERCRRLGEAGRARLLAADPSSKLEAMLQRWVP